MKVRCFGCYSSVLKVVEVNSKEEGIAVANREMAHASIRSASVIEESGKVIWGGIRGEQMVYANGW